MTKTEIIDHLYRVEHDYNVRILLAVESGSRAWGFASPDSDWDVRFIYVHPVRWYLKVEPGRDVIEIMDGEFDAAGWDLRKALQLYRKTNPSMLEWLCSPIRYIDDGFLANALWDFVPEYFNQTHAIHHYLSIAENHNLRYLSNNGVTLKRFLYFFRSLLACKWIIARGTPPPVPFRDLVVSMVESPQIGAAIDQLLKLKSESREHNRDTVDPALFDYALSIAAYVKEFLDSNKLPAPPCNKTAELDNLLYDMATATL